VELQVTHVVPNDMIKLKLLEGTNQNTPIRVAFRRWELHELPSLRETKKEIWQIGTSPNVEKPRYVIFAAQTSRQDSPTSDISKFDNINLSNIQLMLNSECFPYENTTNEFNKSKYTAAYESYQKFR